MVEGGAIRGLNPKPSFVTGRDCVTAGIAGTEKRTGADSRDAAGVMSRP